MAIKVLKTYQARLSKPKSHAERLFRFAEDLTHNLRLGIEHPFIHQALKGRRNSPPSFEQANALYECDMNDLLQEPFCHSARLIATKSGVLSALMYQEADESDDHLDMHGMSSTIRYILMNASHCLCSEAFGASCRQQLEQKDYIVLLSGELDPRAALVVRQDDSCSNHIIGQAVLAPGVRPCIPLLSPPTSQAIVVASKDSPFNSNP